MKFLIISGLSGAGKSRAADVLEDLDYYCVDNLPTALLTKFAELCLAMGGRYERVALVTDVRGQESFAELFEELDKLEAMGVNYSILYMEATEASLIQRYKESRRPHPLADECGTIQDCVQREIELTRPVRARADHIINTTGLSLTMLQHLLSDFYSAEDKPSKMIVNVVSFGYKYGIPMSDFYSAEDKPSKMIVNVVSFGYKYGIPIDADLVFDVRFLPNPFYDEALRPLSGMDEPVQKYVLDNDSARGFLEKLYALVDFLIPQYAEEGRFSLNIAVGCTGGQHRSVAVANALARHLTVNDEDVRLLNRDRKRG